jgi:hypothetical protein
LVDKNKPIDSLNEITASLYRAGGCAASAALFREGHDIAWLAATTRNRVRCRQIPVTHCYAKTFVFRGQLAQCL